MHKFLKSRVSETCLKQIRVNQGVGARTYLQLPFWQWGTGNIYLLVLSSWKVNIAENPIAIRAVPYVFSGRNFEKMQLCAMIASHCDGILEQWVENCCSVLVQSSIESKLRALNSQRFTVWCPDFIDMKFCFYSNLSIFQRFAGYANQNRFFFSFGLYWKHKWFWEKHSQIKTNPEQLPVWFINF